MTTPPPAVNPYAAAEAPSTGPNTLARTSFILAIALVVLAIVLQVVSRFAPLIMSNAGWDANQLGILFAIFAILSLILGVFALVLGIVGARRPGSLVQAGIGIGVGGYNVAISLVSLLSAPLIDLLY